MGNYIYRRVEQLTQLCDFTYATWFCIPELSTFWTKRKSYLCSTFTLCHWTNDITSLQWLLGTKELSWQGRVPYQGYLRRGSVCFRRQFERRSHGGVAPLRVRKQMSIWRRCVPQQGRNVISRLVRAQSGAFSATCFHCLLTLQCSCT